MEMITIFKNEHAFLSNFHLSPFTYKGKEWATVEHAFQGQKTLIDAEQELIRCAIKPKDAKKLGRKVMLRPDWEELRVDIMYEILIEKFTQNLELGNKLMATGDAYIIEGNRWHDNLWGSCFCQRCQENEKGQNLLGGLLMKVRNDLNSKVK